MKLDIEQLYQSTTKLLAPLSLKQTYKVILEEAKYLVEADFGSIFLGKDLKKVYSTVPKGYQGKPRKKGYTYEAYITKRPVIVNKKNFSRIHPKFTKVNVQSVIIIPLCYDEKIVGVLTLWSSHRKSFTKAQLNRIQIFGSMAYLSIRNSELYNRAQQALQLRDLFIAMASHELRTPLTSIYGYSQMLAQRLRKEDSSHAVLVEKLIRRVTRMNELITDLLHIDHIKKGGFSYAKKEINLYYLAKTAALELKFKFPEHKVIVEPKEPDFNTTISGDSTKIAQVFANILNNAAKFSDPNYPITIALRKKKHSLQVKITDKGIGIPSKDLKKVFEGFYKSPEHTKKGMGLGLYVSKTITEDHKGKISVTSKKGKGTTITLEFPQGND